MQALWMLLASLLFATMGVCIKFASAHFSSFEVVFYRGLIGLVFAFMFTGRNLGEGSKDLPPPPPAAPDNPEGEG